MFLDASPSGQKRAAQAATLAQRWGAHLVGVDVVFAGVELPRSMSYARGGKAIQGVVAHKRQLDSDAEAVATHVSTYFRALCADLKVACEFRPIGRERGVEEAVDIAFHSDLVLVGRPAPHGLPEGLSVEKLLLQSGTPVLIVPNAWEGKTIGSSILMERDAKRAVADAMAFLTTAQSVTVLLIDREESCQHGEDPGSEIALHLGRHGVRIDLQQVVSHGFSIPAVLLGFAEQTASDLLVLGAYSHARLKELLLGGTTRTLLAHTPIPTLLSR